MEERMEEMLQMIKRLNEVNEKQTNTIEKQSKTIGKQEVEITKLRRMVVTLKRRYENQKSSNIRPADVSTPNRTILSMIEKEHLHNEDSKSQFVRRFLAPEVSYNPVAFYAYISKDFGGVGANHIFLYDTEVTNQGNGYSKHTGAFTAPSTGLYAFCYTAFASGEHVFGETGEYGEVSVQLVHNGAYKGSIYVDTESHYEEEMATGFAILMLQTGDVVLTKSISGGTGSFHSSDIGRWSFSGFRIS